MALMRLDPFRELDRFTEQVMTSWRVPPTMPVEVRTMAASAEHRLAHPVLMTTQLPTARSVVSGGRSDRS